jgi:large conductance mechanosensitive channel
MSTPKKGLIAEFKDFIATGDLMSIAVAFIIGNAVKAVIDSFVKDIFTGILALFLPCTVDEKTGVQKCGSFETLSFKNKVMYGNFLNTVLSFIIIAAVVFMLVKAYKTMTKKELASDGPTADQALLTEIRDLLKKG